MGASGSMAALDLRRLAWSVTLLIAVWLHTVMSLPSAHDDVTEIACSTTAGDFEIQLIHSWSPRGVARFVELVQAGFFDEQIFYRVIPGFLTQFGVAAKPEVQAVWNDRTFPDEPKKTGFEHGTVSFAGAGENSRSCHVFIAMKPGGLGLGHAPHETPLGRISKGIEFLDSLAHRYEATGYPDLTELQGEIGAHGNIAAKDYPKLDRIKTCKVKEPTLPTMEEVTPRPPPPRPPKHALRERLDEGGEWQRENTGAAADVDLFPQHAPLPEEKPNSAANLFMFFVLGIVALGIGLFSRKKFGFGIGKRASLAHFIGRETKN